MDYADAVDTLERHADELGEDNDITVAIRLVLDDAPTIEDLGEVADQLNEAEAMIERVRELVNSHSLIEAEQLRAVLEGRDEEA